MAPDLWLTLIPDAGRRSRLAQREWPERGWEDPRLTGPGLWREWPGNGPPPWEVPTRGSGVGVDVLGLADPEMGPPPDGLGESDVVVGTSGEHRPGVPAGIGPSSTGPK